VAEGSAIRLLIERARAGDQDAAAELVRDFEPHIRRAVRVQLRDSRLKGALEASDVCQSVLASFFARLAMGQYELSEPRQLTGLLMAMARSKVATRARRSEVRKRAADPADYIAMPEIPAQNPDPGRLVAGRDLLEQFRSRLTPDERALSELRADGLGWPAIAAELGGTPEGLRKKLSRALDRVACALGLDDPSEL
jgi:RNA polymerase sigma-70 factor (ECF subfamily)